ncbi:MAG: ComEC/Rec2 family competence protein, partial [Christensenellales bacterium]
DKGGLEEGITDYYGTSGIGHILAVSGLHVGFITAALAWLLGKLRLNRYAKLGIVSSTLLFYCFLASFSPSVVRASAMCVIGLTADAFGKRRDSLSGLCAAVTAILAIKPLYVYDVGFVLSVSAVAGILMFAETIKRLLKFLRLSVEAMSVSVAAQIGITPTMLVVFGKFTPYSILRICS